MFLLGINEILPFKNHRPVVKNGSRTLLIITIFKEVTHRVEDGSSDGINSGSEIEIEYTVSKIAPYFTFNERDAVAEKGIGSASFSDNGAASGVSSFITGINGEASGRASFVSGVDSNATGEASSALGRGTIASSSIIVFIYINPMNFIKIMRMF